MPVAQVSRRGETGSRQEMGGPDVGGEWRVQGWAGICVRYVTRCNAAISVTACTCHIRYTWAARGSAVGLPMEMTAHIIKGNNGIFSGNPGQNSERCTSTFGNPVEPGAMRISKSNIKTAFSFPCPRPIPDPPHFLAATHVVHTLLLLHPVARVPCREFTFLNCLAFICLTLSCSLPLYPPASLSPSPPQWT